MEQGHMGFCHRPRCDPFQVSPIGGRKGGGKAGLWGEWSMPVEALLVRTFDVHMNHN
jgi:hypothetical protein